MNEDEFVKKFEERFRAELQKALAASEEVELKPSEKAALGIQNPIKLPCRVIEDTRRELYLVRGKENIAKVYEKERESGGFKYPCLYFEDGECPELFKKLGITKDGVYLLTRDKKIKDVTYEMTS